MNDTITEKHTAYARACSLCIDDLYRTAYLALADASAAEKLVTGVCADGVNKYRMLETEAEIRFCLAADLYHRVKRRLWLLTPDAHALPEQLQGLTKQERLIVAMRFSSGLSAEDSGRILGLPQGDYRKLVNEIMGKTMREGKRGGYEE